MKFFKISKTIPEKTTVYIRYGDAPEGNTVVCIAQKENGEKKVLLKKGDIEGNESLYRNPNLGDNQMDTFGYKAEQTSDVDDVSPNPEYNQTGTDGAQKDKGSDVEEAAPNSGYHKMSADGDEAPQDFEDEILPKEKEFAIGREIFCAGIVRDIDPACTPKYNRYYKAETHAPLIGSDFIDNFRSWKASYNYEDQTLLGFKINAGGLIDFVDHKGFPVQQKRIRGLGVCAVLLAILGRDDRGGENWGLIEKSNHLQVVLIDFGRCLCSMMFADKEKNESEHSFANPFEIVKAVFQQYNTPDEPPLPSSFFESAHIKYEVFETIEKLYNMPAASLEKRAEDNFKQFPLFKEAILRDKKRGIEHLYNQFKDNKEYIATQYINEVLERTGVCIKLSELDDETTSYLQSLYTYLNPFEAPYKRDLFFKQVANILNPTEPNETPRTAPQSM